MQPTAKSRTSGAAYDYKAQRWVVGDDARELRRAQLKEELATLEGARGSEYLAFLGMTESLPKAIEKVRAMLAECGKELNAEQLRAARDWIADCQWADDVTELTDDQVVRGIVRHYEGGLAGFRLANG